MNSRSRRLYQIQFYVEMMFILSVITYVIYALLQFSNLSWSGSEIFYIVVSLIFSVIPPLSIEDRESNL